MSPLSLNLRVKLAPPAARSAVKAPVRFSSPTIGKGLMPARGLVYSVVVHQIFFTCLVLWFVPSASTNAQRYQLSRVIDFSKPNEVIYLPAFGGGSEGSGHAGGEEGIPARGSEEGDKARKGFTYSGPQHIVSHPKSPTNDLQTILQPDLPNPQTLKQFVPLPNVVQMAAPKAPKKILPDKIQAPKQPSAKSAVPVDLTLPSNTPSTNPTASLTLPLADPDEPAAPRHVVHADQMVKNPNAPHRTDSNAAPNIQANGTDARTLVALSPMPSPASPMSSLPLGEARGEFAISPEPNTGSAKAGAGSPASTSPTGNISAGGSGASGAGNSAGESAHGTSTGNSIAGIGTGGTGGAGTGTGKETGSGNGGNGGGTARGSAVGPGTGNGLGLTIGNGSGGGSGAGRGNFPGLTIRGGELETGAAKPPDPGEPLEPQKSYALTIAGTASSGGGLGDYGVFSNEKVYTVYVDMRRTTTDRSPSWILQYAPSVAAKTSGFSVRGQEGVVPPLPVLRPAPEIPQAMREKFAKELVVISGFIDTEGRLTNLAVRQSPDDELSNVILQALATWEFRPARMNSEPIKTKILLGIPLPGTN